jgi:hypothetical protein
MTTALHRYKFIFLLAITIHLVWAALLIASPDPQFTTPIHQSAVVLGRWPTAGTFAFVALLALAGLWWKKCHGWLLLPQTAILIAATSGGLYAASVGHYADGTVRSWQFILADQFPVLALAAWHLVAVLFVVAEAE